MPGHSGDESAPSLHRESPACRGAGSAVLHQSPGEPEGPFFTAAVAAPQSVSWSHCRGEAEESLAWRAVSEPPVGLTWERGQPAWSPWASPVLPPAWPISLGSFAAGLSSIH